MHAQLLLSYIDDQLESLLLKINNFETHVMKTVKWILTFATDVYLSIHLVE